MVQELQGFDRSLVDHVDHLEVPCHGAPLGLQDVVQSGDGALEVLVLADDAATPGSDNCAGTRPAEPPGGEKEQTLTGQSWRGGREEDQAEGQEGPAARLSCGPAGAGRCSCCSSLGWAGRGAGPARGRKRPV